MQRLFLTTALGFFILILWIIYLANTGQSNILFDIISYIPYGDKIGHFMLYGVLTLLANLAFAFKLFKLAVCKVYIGSTLVLIFALIEELSQHYFSTRTLDFYDLVADSLGVAMFSGISYLIYRRTLE
jgi:VanZ family protein